VPIIRILLPLEKSNSTLLKRALHVLENNDPIYGEAAFLIKVVHKVDENAKHFQRITGYKIYLTNPSLRTALFSPITPTDDEAGNCVETAIYAQWMHRDTAKLHYAKWKNVRFEGEVDMIQLDDSKLKPLWALEIKWSNRYVENPKKLKSLRAFCAINNLQSSILTSIDKQEHVELDGLELNIYPAAVYAYVIGANTLLLKGSEECGEFPVPELVEGGVG